MPVVIDELNVTDASGGSDIFLYVKTKTGGEIAGEAVASGHEGDTPLSGWKWGMAAGNAPGTTQATGRRTYKELTVYKTIDAATTPMMTALSRNDLVTELRLAMRKSGGEQEDYFKITLNNARITALDHVAGADGSTLETVSFAFTKVSVEYYRQLESGRRGGGMQFTDEYQLGGA